jgi:hypothetical protein
MALIEIVPILDCAQPVPVWMPAPPQTPDGPLVLQEEGAGRSFPAQKVNERIVAVLPGYRAGQKRQFRVVKATAAPGPGVQLKEEGPHALAVLLPEGPFTTYNFDPAVARPFFYPVLGPGGKMVTRSFPMKDVPGEMRDHPHHRSFWTAYGEVNDADNWSEAPGKHGFTRHQRFASRAEGPVVAAFEALAVWTSREGKPLLDERRSVRFYNLGPERRLLDYRVDLIAAHGDVHYGDTKEGGILAFRVATSMDGNKGGLMENNHGLKGERQVWGKRAEWLDYSGPVEGQVYGIGMMEHPANLNHPCYWHARDYGLVGTNPFARASFEPGQPNTGHHQKNGETLRFRYRVLFHKGGAKEGGVDDAYHAWIQPPQAKVAG